MTRETLGLTEEQIRERVMLLDAVDDRACPCGTQAGAVADDPDWFIDSYLVANPEVPGDYTVHAVIRCPWCW